MTPDEQGVSQWMESAWKAEALKAPSLIPELTLTVLWRYVHTGIQTSIYHG